MNISEVIKNRTSLRVYDDRMIEDQDLEKILEAASLAPTAGNQQLYSIIVIKSQETKDKLSENAVITSHLSPRRRSFSCLFPIRKNGLIITSWRAARSFLSGSPGFSGKLPMNRI